VAALAAEGVTHLFGNPGSTELPLLEALGRQDDVRYVLCLHEGVAVGMADGHAQAAGRLAAVNVHVQPGLANALAGILNASRARVPLLVTAGQQVRAMLPEGPFLGGDLVGMARPLAKGAWEAADAADLAELTAHAIRVARRPPAGPVVLSLPLDVQAGPAPPAHEPQAPASATPPDPGRVAEAAAILGAARMPVVLAGDGVAHAGAAGALAAVAERLGAPVHGEPFGALVTLATDHPLWRGPLPGFAAEIAPRLARHDAVLAVGMPVFRLFGTSPGRPLPPGAPLVHVDVDPVEVGRSHPAAVGLVADPRATLDGLLDRLGAAPPDAAARRAVAVAETARSRREARAGLARAASGEAVSPAALCRAVAAAVGPRDLVVDEALTAGRPLRTALGRRAPGTWLAHRGSALGWGLPAAVGAKLADPGRRVLCLQGDGSLLFGVTALWTAAHEGLDVAVVVADNGGYEILRAGLEGLTGRPEGPWPGLALGPPALDLAAVARGLGASVAGCEGAADLPGALRDLWRRTREGPAVLVVRVAGRTPAVGYPLA
jgi:benzoylformate decarboxylase